MKLRFILCAVCALCAFAQPPDFSSIVNARTETHPVSGTLEQDMRRIIAASQSPEWTAYLVPALAGRQQSCCSNSGGCCTACALEGRGSVYQSPTNLPQAAVHLEGSGSVFILFRTENHALERIRVYSSDCRIDAGNLPVHLLTGVGSATSLAYLESLAPAHKDAVMAIAMHGDAAADAALDRLAATSQPEKIREDVAFWSGSARGAAGVRILQKMAAGDPSERVRDKVMFGLSISKDPGALPLLLASARNDSSGKVRGQALFWLAHKAGQKETAAITQAVNDDPDLHVKRQAVFALHELPRDQGIPLLIQVARTNKDPQVRKQAMFWLGQTNDPRAVKFFEDVLTK